VKLLLFHRIYHEFLEIERDGVIVSDHTFYKINLNYRLLWKTYQLLSTFFDGCFMQEKGMSATFQVPLHMFYEKIFAA